MPRIVVMQELYNIIGYIHWDPHKEAFNIPYFDHPIVWYGVLFVAGFILAYFIINPIFVRFLLNTRQLFLIDILNWESLIKELRTSSSPLVSKLLSHLDFSTRQQLDQKLSSPPSLSLKQKLLKGFNDLLQNSSTSREELQQIFGKSIASPKQTAYFLTDRLSWFIVAGTVIGARLGDVLLYDWLYFKEHPFEIFKIWHGGLASHGGVIGILIAAFLYIKYIQRTIPQLTFLCLLDYLTIPSALVACFIRLGNLMNQEILGIPTLLPWGIIFEHPMDGSMPVPRHPVQLYEALAYLITFFTLWILWKKQSLKEEPGNLLGIFFIMIFGSRFILEFWKANLDSILPLSFLQIGQLLSLPFILFGFYLLWTRTAFRKNEKMDSQRV